MPKPPPEVTDRLKLANPANYRLPFEDGTFDEELYAAFLGPGEVVFGDWP